jgi:iron complex outermembrane receptor protein
MKQTWTEGSRTRTTNGFVADVWNNQAISSLAMMQFVQRQYITWINLTAFKFDFKTGKINA